MSYRWFVLAVFVFVQSSAALADAGTEQEAVSNRPNIILIMADDLGYGDVGFTGNQNIKTPSIDRLAADGVVMNRFYTSASICSPSRAAALTGRHHYRSGVAGGTYGRSADRRGHDPRGSAKTRLRYGLFWQMASRLDTAG